MDGGNVDRGGGQRTGAELYSIEGKGEQGDPNQNDQTDLGSATNTKQSSALSAQNKGAVLLKTLLDEKRSRGQALFRKEQNAAKLNAMFSRKTSEDNSDVKPGKTERS